MAPEPDQPLDDDIVMADDPAPFRPPSGYQFEDELQGPPPRLRTDELKQGRYAVKQRKWARGMITAGAMLAALGPLPFVQTIGLYVLPFAYLTWIGLGILALGGFAAVRNMLARGPYRYVEEGVPIVCCVRALRFVPAAVQHGTPVSFRFDAMIDYLDPKTSQLRTADVASSVFTSMEKDKLTTSYRVGDYATAVYLPSDPEKTLRLYGFLDLRPGLGLVRRDDEAEPANPLKTVLAIAGCVGFFAAFLWGLYAINRFQAITISAGTVLPILATGAVVIGGPILWLVAGQTSRSRLKREQRKAEALARGEPVEADDEKKRGPFGAAGCVGTFAVILGACGMGGMLAFTGALTLNALLDRSPARSRPVVIDEMVQVTHRAIFREYNLKYHFADDPAKKYEFFSTPAHLDTFDGPLAVAEIHDGWFGWPWVKEIRPAAHRMGPAGRPGP